MGNTRPRVNGKFASQTATRTHVDERQAATVEELADGSRLLTSGPEIEELADGSQIITARPAAGEAVEEAEALAEPLIFSNPLTPNMTLAGTVWKIAPGTWKKNPRRYIRFINGHCRVTNRQDAERVRRSFPTVKGQVRVWEEPAGLLSEDEAARRGLDPPYLAKDGAGKVLFWTYHRKALELFWQTYNAHRGV